MTEVPNPTPPHPLPAGLIYREWRYTDGSTGWTVTRDLGHGCDTGTGGRGVPTAGEWRWVLDRIKPTEAK